MSERFNPIPETPKATSEKKELILETQEILDANGERIATMEMAYEPGSLSCGESLRSGEEVHGRALRELRIRNDAVTIDVLELANAKRHRVEVRVASEDLDNYSYTPNIATSPPLRNAVDVAVLLHELGHADQKHTKEYGSLLHRPPYNAEELEKMLDAFPGSREKLQRTEIEACKRIMAEHESAKREEDELGTAYYRLLHKDDKTEEELERLPAMEAQYLAARRRTEELERQPVEQFPDVVLLRMRVLEHDATRRALRWLHEMKKKGIDLLRPARVAARTTVAARFPEGSGTITPCEASLRTGLEEAETDISPQEELEAGLGTYGATKERLRGSYQGGIPSPGRVAKKPESRG